MARRYLRCIEYVFSEFVCTHCGLFTYTRAWLNAKRYIALTEGRIQFPWDRLQLRTYQRTLVKRPVRRRMSLKRTYDIYIYIYKYIMHRISKYKYISIVYSPNHPVFEHVWFDFLQVNHPLEKNANAI